MSYLVVAEIGRDVVGHGGAGTIPDNHDGLLSWRNGNSVGIRCHG